MDYLKYFYLLRPTDWLKNLIILLPIIFSGYNLDYFEPFQILYVFIFLSLLSSTVYVLNDIIDFKEDKNNNSKKKRPLASGIISKKNATIYFFILLFMSCFALFFFKKQTVLLGLTFLLLNFIYCFKIKQFFFVDGLSIALSYVIRVCISASEVNIPVTWWLISLVLISAQLVIFIKRRVELKNNKYHRFSLRNVNLKRLNLVIKVYSTFLIILYIIYSYYKNLTFTLTIPFFIIILLRFTYISNTGKIDSPVKIILSDFLLIFAILLWTLLSVFLIF